MSAIPPPIRIRGAKNLIPSGFRLSEPLGSRQAVIVTAARTTTSIYIASPEGDTGKSTVALGILHRLTAMAPRAGVFRPITRRENRDYILELLLAHSNAGLTYEECVGVTYQRLHADPGDDGAPTAMATQSAG